MDNENYLVITRFMDLFSAIDEKKRFELLYYYSEPIRIGKIAHFLNNVSRDKPHNVIEKREFRSLLQLFGLDGLDLKEFFKSKDFIADVESEVGKIVIKINSFDEIINYCYQQWVLIESLDLLKDEHICVKEILLKTITPIKKDELAKLYKKYACYKKVLVDLKDLGLIAEKESYIYSPTFFKTIKENTADMLAKYNITSDNLIAFYEQISSTQAYPMEYIDDNFKGAIKEGAFLGILTPIEIKLPDKNRSFIFTNPEILKNYDLSYETAAYFRFNQYFAKEEHGRLKTPTLFLRRLLDGKAGNATNIGTNYDPLQLKGVIRVVKGVSSGRFSMIPLKKSVIEESKVILQSANQSLNIFTKVSEPPNWMNDPAAYRSTIRSDEREKNLHKLKDIFKDYG
ncbi:MAG: hypothetical protein ACTSXD_01490 [Candidatus Heimdallarchaeaceae archaeon]